MEKCDTTLNRLFGYRNRHFLNNCFATINPNSPPPSFQPYIYHCKCSFITAANSQPADRPLSPLRSQYSIVNFYQEILYFPSAHISLKSSPAAAARCGLVTPPAPNSHHFCFTLCWVWIMKSFFEGKRCIFSRFLLFLFFLNSFHSETLFMHINALWIF